jgi:Asp-tRNA(Asn)/Glu-tRNA(Gln) amidotransferase A subunit family amidase
MSASLQIAALQAAYRAGATTPTAVLRQAFARIDATADHRAWISLCDRNELLARAADL